MKCTSTHYLMSLQLSYSGDTKTCFVPFEKYVINNSANVNVLEHCTGET